MQKDKTKWYHTKPISLDHDERPVVLNERTGEVKEIYRNPNRKGNPNVVKHKPEKTFQKNFPRAWQLLETQVTSSEYMVAHKLAMRAKAFNNSLIPFQDSQSYRKMARVLNEDHRTFKKAVDKLFTLGVLGKFEVADRNQEYRKYWIFNPYLSFNGQNIEKGILQLFKDTYYASQTN